MKSFFIVVVLFSWQSIGLAQELRGYCFPRNVNLDQVKTFISEFLLKGEQVFLRRSKNCIEVKVSPERSELIYKILKMEYKIASDYQDGTSLVPQAAVRQHCRILITKKVNHQSTTDEVSAGKKNRLKQTDRNSLKTSRSQLLLSAGRPGNLKVNGENVEITCNPAGERFQIVVALSTDAEGAGLSTNILVSKGEPIQLGSVVKNLADKKRTLSVNSGVTYEKTKGEEAATFELVVE